MSSLSKCDCGKDADGREAEKSLSAELYLHASDLEEKFYEMSGLAAVLEMKIVDQELTEQISRKLEWHLGDTRMSLAKLKLTHHRCQVDLDMCEEYAVKDEEVMTDMRRDIAAFQKMSADFINTETSLRADLKSSNDAIQARNRLIEELEAGILVLNKQLRTLYPLQDLVLELERKQHVSENRIKDLNHMQMTILQSKLAAVKKLEMTLGKLENCHSSVSVLQLHRLNQQMHERELMENLGQCREMLKAKEQEMDNLIFTLYWLGISCVSCYICFVLTTYLFRLQRDFRRLEGAGHIYLIPFILQNLFGYFDG